MHSPLRAKHICLHREVALCVSSRWLGVAGQTDEWGWKTVDVEPGLIHHEAPLRP